MYRYLLIIRRLASQTVEGCTWKCAAGENKYLYRLLCREHKEGEGCERWNITQVVYLSLAPLKGFAFLAKQTSADAEIICVARLAANLLFVI